MQSPTSTTNVNSKIFKEYLQKLERSQTDGLQIVRQIDKLKALTTFQFCGIFL